MDQILCLFNKRISHIVEYYQCMTNVYHITYFLFWFWSVISPSHRYKNVDFHYTQPFGWCILCEPSLRTVLASWVSGGAPCLPLKCKLLRWENQVGGNLINRSKQNSGFIQRKIFFPCHNTKAVLYVCKPSQ